MKMSFKKVIELCEKNGFLQKYSVPKLDNVFKIDPVGVLLKENLKLEWLHSMVVNKEHTVFLSETDSFSDSFNKAKCFCLDTLPFGVAEFSNKKNMTIRELIENVDNKEINFHNCFESSLIMSCTMFVPSSTSDQFFRQWQRHRRIWWRKFSASPGRFSLSDIRTDDSSKSQLVDVRAKYPWGNQVLETIVLNTSQHPALSVEQLQFKQGRKLQPAHHIRSEISLSAMLLNTICDAYEEPPFQGTPRPLLRFHRKIAPYKISFAIPNSQKSVSDELCQLALYLCKQLRSNCVSCLMLPSFAKFTLEAQWKQYDQLGVPYTIHLNERTLKDGVALLRSRDTTLKEQVHVSDVVTYVEQLFKNY